MTIKVEINSRKLGRPVQFVARDGSGYVYIDPDALTWGQQVFDRHGSAVVARTEAELRRIARRWVSAAAVA